MNPNDPVRERLLQAARDLFAQHGYDGTSVRDITARAKANLGAITYHFGSKEDLFHTVIRTIAEPLVQAFTEAAQGPGGALERVEAITRAAARHIQANPWAPRVMLRELAGGGPLPPPMIQAWKRNIATLIGLISAGQQDGSIRPGDPLLLALSAVAQVFFFQVGGRIIAREAAAVDLGDPAMRSRVADHVAETVRRSLVSSLRKTEP